MSRYRKITTICCAAVFALGLAACGGGDDGISVADRDAAVAAEQAKTEALQKEIDALRAQLELEDGGNVGNSIAALQAEVMRLKGLVDAAEKAENAEATKAMIATATALKMAIDGRNAAATAMHDDKGLNVDVDGDATDEATLKAGMDMSYSHMDAKAKMSYDAMVYSDRGMSTMKKFSEYYGGDTNTNRPEGSSYDEMKRELSALPADTALKIGGSDFPTELEKTFKKPDSGVVEVAGTFEGIAGTYYCSGAEDCTATYGSAGIALSSGTWRFVHQKDAMVSIPDANYLYYGWWVQKDKDGKPTATNVFAEFAGAEPMKRDVTTESSEGSATYTGSAAGKYAMTNTAAGTAEGGHFTADVTLTAKFGGTSVEGAGLSGMVENFMAGGESKPWSVTLARQGWNATGGTEPATDDDDTATDESMTTTWSIDGNKAAADGTWMGQTYDTTTGPADDGLTTPTDVIGTFNAKFETSGSMIGAFGANKQ